MILDGKVAAQSYKEELKKEIAKLKEKNVFPKMAIIQILGDEASEAYLRSRQKLADELGVEIECVKLAENVSQEALIAKIEELNKDDKIQGIMLDRPLPKHLVENEVFISLAIEKDIDGCSPMSALKLNAGEKVLVSSTAQAVVDLLDYYDIKIPERKITVIGRSKSVGAPLACLLRQRKALVTVCHTQTEDLKGDCRSGEILIVAMGKMEYINTEYVTPSMTVVDVGMHRNAEGKLRGDVSRDVWPIVKNYSPVPGGVGPLTTVALFRNLIKAIRG